jgi:hypothetical protein
MALEESSDDDTPVEDDGDAEEDTSTSDEEPAALEDTGNDEAAEELDDAREDEGAREEDVPAVEDAPADDETVPDEDDEAADEDELPEVVLVQAVNHARVNTAQNLSPVAVQPLMSNPRWVMCRRTVAGFPSLANQASMSAVFAVWCRKFAHGAQQLAQLGLGAGGQRGPGLPHRAGQRANIR